MASLIVGREWALSALEAEPTHIVREISLRYKYGEDGKRTSDVAGYVYSVVNTGSFDDYRVFVEGQKTPVMDPKALAALREDGGKLVVEFINAKIRPYYNLTTKQIEDSIKAEDIKVVK